MKSTTSTASGTGSIPGRMRAAGLALLKRRHVIATLSNGNVALLVNMAKHGRLPWDAVLSAELFHHYKPDPEAYLGAAAMLGCEPSEVMMVAAHKNDLRAAQACGLATAFVRRPREKGSEGEGGRDAGSRFRLSTRRTSSTSRAGWPR